MKEWYGPNCLKKWDGKKWVETLPIEKRHPKHVENINLEDGTPDIVSKKKGSNLIRGITLAVFILLLALLLFNDFSLKLLGLGIMFIGITINFNFFLAMICGIFGYGIIKIAIKLKIFINNFNNFKVNS